MVGVHGTRFYLKELYSSTCLNGSVFTVRTGDHELTYLLLIRDVMFWCDRWALTVTKLSIWGRIFLMQRKWLHFSSKIFSLYALTCVTSCVEQCRFPQQSSRLDVLVKFTASELHA